MRTYRNILESTEFTEHQSNPANQYYRINVQQLAKTPILLDALRAPDGYSFVQLDYAALEPNVLAEFSQDKTYLELYASGKVHDIYLYVACKLLDSDGKIKTVYQPESETPQAAKAKKLFKKERSIAKVIHLMATYKAGAAAIHRKLGLSGIHISREETNELRERYWGPELFGGVLEFEQHLLQERLQRGGWITNGLGRPLVVTDRKERDILNTFCQSTGHDCLDIFIKHVELLAQERHINAVPCVPDYHDETVWLVPDSQASELADVMTQAVKLTNDDIEFSIPLKGEPEITQTFTGFKQPDPTHANWYENKTGETK